MFLLLAGCNGGGEYPSYSGTYRLVNEVVSGQDGWPYDPRVPELLEVTQDVFRRHQARNRHVLAMESGDPELPGAIGVYDFTERARLSFALLRTTRWDDVTSPLVNGITAGHRCHYLLAANMEIQVSPAPDRLNRLYSYVGADGIMPAPWNARRELPSPEVEAWRAEGTPRISFLLSAGKYNDEYPEYPCERVVAGHHSLRLTYERISPRENVDLRFDAPPELEAALEEVRAEPSLIPLIYPVPETAQELVEIFGR